MAELRVSLFRSTHSHQQSHCQVWLKSVRPSRARGGQCCMQTSAAHRALDSSDVFGCTAALGTHPWDSPVIFLSHWMCRLSAWNCIAGQSEDLRDCGVLCTFGFPAAGKAQSRSCSGVGLRGFKDVA